MAILSTQNLVKQYANHLALDKVSIEVPEGKIFGLLGPNGAGKTTLIRIINQITAPDSGEVMLFNKPINREDISRIGYLPEERGLYKKMKIGEQLLYLARLKGITKHDAVQKIKYWSKRFEIEAWYHKTIEELSKGMQQKVQFIATVIHDPKLLILDEPFSGFDPINALLLKEEILNLKKSGTSIILSTHNMASVEEICDDIALINQGVVLLSGSVKAVRESSRHNTLKVEIKTDTPLTNELVEIFNTQSSVEIKGDHQLITLSLNDSYTINEAITRLLPLGRIISVNEQLPTMNDIFISSVNKHNQNK